MQARTRAQLLDEMRAASVTPCAHSRVLNEHWQRLVDMPGPGINVVDPSDPDGFPPVFRGPDLETSVPGRVRYVFFVLDRYCDGHATVFVGKCGAWRCSMCRKTRCRHFHQVPFMPSLFLSLNLSI